MAIRINDPTLPTYHPRYQEPLEEKESKRQERRQEEVVSSASSSDVFSAVHERRSQENPHLRQTKYDLTQSLKKDGLNIDLETATQVVKATEAAPQFFPGQKLDLENPDHLRKCQLLLAIQQNNETFLKAYQPLEVQEARNELEKFNSEGVERLKKVLNGPEVAIGLTVLDTITKVPVSQIINPLIALFAKPGEFSSIGAQDFVNFGCIGTKGYISIDRLGAAADCFVDKSGQWSLNQGFAGNLQEQAAEIASLQKQEVIHDQINQSFEEGIDSLNGRVASLEKHNENTQKLAEEAEKITEKAWNSATKILEAAAGSLGAYNAMQDRLSAAKEMDRAQKRAFFKEGREVQEALARIIGLLSNLSIQDKF